MNFIGLDRFRLINVPIISIDLNKYKGAIRFGEGITIIDSNTGEYIEISDLIITIKGESSNEKDNYLMKLKLNRIPYINISLDINGPRLLYGTNEKNINTIAELYRLKSEIELKLKEYGVVIDIERSILSNFEMNYNSQNNKLLNSLKLIKKAWDNERNKVFNVEFNGEIESLMIRLSDRKIKIYNKTKQLIDIGQFPVNETTIRIEVSTNNTMLIRRLCKSKVARIDDFINNFECIQQWFINTVEKRIKRPIQSYYLKKEDYIVKKLKNGNRAYDVLLGIATEGNLVDIKIFDNGIKRYYMETGKKKPHNVIKRCHCKLKEFDDNLYESVLGNIEVINETLNCLETKIASYKNE